MYKDFHKLDILIVKSINILVTNKMKLNILYIYFNIYMFLE